MQIELTLPEGALKKIEETITIDQMDKDLSMDCHLIDIFRTHTNIIKCGLKDFDGKLTSSEVHYILASINGIYYPNTEIAHTAESFVYTLIDFDVYEKEQAEQFGVNGKELAAKIKKEHPISQFVLLSVLHQCWVVCSDGDFQEYVEQHLKLKA